MRTIKVHVTQRDIRDGEPESYSSCPVALALGRTLGFSENDRLERVAVCSEQIEVGGKNGWKIKTPAEVDDFISNFDDPCCDVEPFCFELELPECASLES